jgi:hypothetical protein
MIALVTGELKGIYGEKISCYSKLNTKWFSYHSLVSKPVLKGYEKVEVNLGKLLNIRFYVCPKILNLGEAFEELLKMLLNSRLG